VHALAAVLPILVILGLMLGLRWSAARAGVVGLIVTAAVAVWVFDFPAGLEPAVGLAVGLATGFAGVAAEAGFTSITILWIIGPALGIFELQSRTGANEVLRDALAQLTPDPKLLALLVAWFFALFMEGAAGFGTSVALAAPFLVSAGFTPMTAVVAAMIGHSVGVSFGAVGTPVIPQVAATDLTALEIAQATGLYHSLLGWIPLVAVMLVVVRATGREHIRPAAVITWTAAAGVAFLLPFTLLSQLVGPELPTLGGALFGAMIFVGLLLVARRTALPLPMPVDDEPRDLDTPPGALLRAGSPYLVLVALVLVTRLITPLRELLQGVEVSWSFAGFSGSAAPLYNPGTMLLVGFLLGAVIQGAGGEVRGAVTAATKRLGTVTVALVALLALSRLLVHAGMIDALAEAAATSTGGAWPIFAPLVGTLGTFVTGSATASNILFTDFQQATALRLDLATAPLIGAQGFGAAIGNAICPHNIVAASATVSLTGEEGQVLRRTIGITLLYSTLGGVVAFLLVS
jgi:lactate permease